MVAYLNEVDLREGFIVSWFLDIENRYDVLMVEVSKQLHLSECAQAEH